MMVMNMKTMLTCALTVAAVGTASAKIRPTNTIDIPYTKVVLPNGLTVIVHEDHKAPIVAVNVWYHVGSKNEKPGKTGFAHLFEHLMFNGSEHFNNDFFEALKKVGATDANGTTNEDRTNYFENAPKDALDYLLWLESDRMGHLLPAIDQAKLDEQRGVVQNEKRQYENEPYAISEELITKGTWPPGHPYSWTVIGSMEDLNAATLEDVREWFNKYYGAANAVLSIAGDVNTDEVIKKVEKYFGHIPPGPPIARHKAWVPVMQSNVRQVAHDRVPQARIYKVWNIPQYGTTELNMLDLASDILGYGKNSRLYKRLVYKDQIATDVSAYVDPREIASQFYIVATAKPDGDLSKVEQAINEELEKFLKTGPTQKELQRVKNQFEASFVRGIERIGGFGGKSDVLAYNYVFTGNPDYYKIRLQEVLKATAADVHQVSKKWLTNCNYTLEIHPYPKYTTNPPAVDRSTLPVPELKPESKFPKLERSELPNGLKIILARQPTIPVVEFDLVLNAGYASDSLSTPGTARLAMAMLMEGTKKRTSLQISEELALLGAMMGCGSDLDSSYVYLNALKKNLDKSLDIFADVVLNPTFPEADFKRLQQQTIAGIKREKAEPGSMGMRVLPKLLYGQGHAYSIPFTGSGTEESVAKLTPADMKKFHSTWFKPNNATLIVVGDTTMEEIKPKIERLFRNWKPAEVPKLNIAQIDPRSHKRTVYIVDRPGSIQSFIFAANIATPKSDPDDIAIKIMNKILGGDFTSRINMNLREDKHWTYGAHSVIADARGPRPFLAYVPVQTDKTKDAMLEIAKELEGVVSSKPITKEEFEGAVKDQILKLAGIWETMSRVSSSIAEIVKYGLPDDYYQTYAQKLQSLNLDKVNEVAKRIVLPEHTVWVVVGDRSKIEADIKSLNFGEIKFIDSDGNPVVK
jgi:zinc protease